MSRNDFLALLNRLLEDGAITEERARELLQLFDDGELDFSAPLSPTELIPQDDSFIDEAAILALLLLLVGRTDNRAALEKIQALDDIQDDYQRRAMGLVPDLVRDDDEPGIAEMQLEVRNLLTAMSGSMILAGAGLDEFTPDERATLLQLIQLESAFLSRFGDHLALAQMEGRPLSAGSIAARLALYGAGARVAASQLIEETDPTTGTTGYVSEYIAVDDSGTCSPCHNAQGFYLPGQGPYPGQICLGRGRCRCRRITVFNMQAYERLTAIG